MGLCKFLMIFFRLTKLPISVIWKRCSHSKFPVNFTWIGKVFFRYLKLTFFNFQKNQIISQRFWGVFCKNQLYKWVAIFLQNTFESIGLFLQFLSPRTQIKLRRGRCIAIIFFHFPWNFSPKGQVFFRSYAHIHKTFEN